MVEDGSNVGVMLAISEADGEDDRVHRVAEASPENSSRSEVELTSWCTQWAGGVGVGEGDADHRRGGPVACGSGRAATERRSWTRSSTSRCGTTWSTPLEHPAQPRLQRDQQPDLRPVPRPQPAELAGQQPLQVVGRWNRPYGASPSSRRSRAAAAAARGTSPRPGPACRSSAGRGSPRGSRSRDRLLEQVLLDRAAQLQLRRDRRATARRPRGRTAATRGSTPNGALSASTFGRMWWPPLSADVDRLQPRDEVRPARVARAAAPASLRAAPRRARRAPSSVEHRRQVVVALQVRPQVARLARRLPARRRRSSSASSIGRFFGPPKHGSPPSPLSTTPTSRGGLAEQQGVRAPSADRRSGR